MEKNKLPISQNPLRTKEDLRLAFAQLTGPLKIYYSAGSAQLQLGHTGASYASDVAGYEGFSRVLWGLVPLLAGGGDSDLWETILRGIANGTDPAHEEYWGEPKDYDQRSVEMAAFGFALALIPDKLKGKLSEPELERFVSWLRSISDRKLWDCNWLFFRVLVHLGLKKAGFSHDRQLVESTLDEIERFYLEDGWYADGVGGHSDYYVPFAIHFYGLLYAKLMEEDDPARSRLYKERAALFAEQFIYWFAENGAALPYGRSLAYRFSQSAFWSALVYAGVEPFPLGVMKGLIMRNLRWWFAQPIFHADGTLSIGYAYPNLIMAENYNAPGSPYWALKTFLPLALPDDHPFWAAEELPLPPLGARSVQKAPHLIVCRQTEVSHVLAFNSGHLSTNEHTHTSAKYEKFVYSTFFGFSVPRAEWGLAQGAFDSMLALSEEDNLYRVKRKCEEISVEDGLVYARWTPWSDVEVRTWLIPGTPWHVRVHRIGSARALDAADGGFALGIERSSGLSAAGELRVAEAEGGVCAVNADGASGIRLLYGGGRAELIYPHANTNLLHNRTVIPTVKAKLPAGTSWLVTAVYGDAAVNPSLQRWEAAPVAKVEEGQLAVYMPGEDGPAFQINIL
ncbi:DUF2264 domain-containing protein [Paenibacillus hamazuiensis]|uniref:DUF2264 domain-containing protein n=1 Tax=Paenibacillus hamazuiensis TaxID=2936508 RepID=UPI00200D7EE6|nr:DUF2264 domain-containing protein [Paenibacillus hamazuiensis]